MSDKKEVLIRLGFDDVRITKKQNENLSGYAKLYDDEGNLITETATFLVGYEFEDGTECNEDGEEL